MLWQKAEFFARQFGNEDPKITMAWIECFKKRWGIAKINKSGEAGDVDIEVVNKWKDGRLVDILNRYKAEDIFNANETGLFWQMLPENTLGFIGQTLHSGKQPKTRITLLMATNMDGSKKLPLFIIGKSKKLRAFKGVKRLQTDYTANKKAWMMSELFKAWVKQFDRVMTGKRKKVALIVNNCPT